MEIGQALLKAFNLSSKNCKGFEIRCYVDKPVIIKAEYIAELKDDTEELKNVIRTFKLVEI